MRKWNENLLVLLDNDDLIGPVLVCFGLYCWYSIGLVRSKPESVACERLKQIHVPACMSAQSVQRLFIHCVGITVHVIAKLISYLAVKSMHI